MSSSNRRPSLIPHTFQQPWQNQRQFVATLGLIVVVGLIIAALYLFQTSYSTVTGRELEQMGNDRTRLESDNERLRAEIAQLESLPRRMTRAAELGFHEAQEDEIQYIIVQGYAYNRSDIEPTPTPTPAPASEIYDETLGGWLRQQWDGVKTQFSKWRNKR